MTQLEIPNEDDGILKESQLPHWLDMQCLYLFRYDNATDKSEFFLKIPCTEISLVEAVATKSLEYKERYCFRVVVQEKVHIFLVETAIDCNSWMKSLRAGKQIQEEINKTSAKTLNKNIEYLFYYYRKNRTEEIHVSIDKEFYLVPLEAILDENQTIDSFIKAARQSQENYRQVLFYLQVT